MTGVQTCALPISFGQRLRILRNNAGLTQKELGERLKLSKSNISKYESDDVEPNIQTINDIANTFDVSADFLLGLPAIKQRVLQPQKEDPILSSIDTLSEESKKELEKYVHLLKMKDQMDKGKDELSSALEKEA